MRYISRLIHAHPVVIRPFHTLVSLLSCLFIDYISGRKQRVVLVGKSSERAEVKMVVPQGSILGPTLFLLFVNIISDVVNNCFSTVNLYADDTMIYSTDMDPKVLGARVEKDLIGKSGSVD